MFVRSPARSLLSLPYEVTRLFLEDTAKTLFFVVKQPEGEVAPASDDSRWEGQGVQAPSTPLPVSLYDPGVQSASSPA